MKYLIRLKGLGSVNMLPEPQHDKVQRTTLHEPVKCIVMNNGRSLCITNEDQGTVNAGAEYPAFLIFWFFSIKRKERKKGYASIKQNKTLKK